jgi:hypothetical protein
VNEEVFAAVIGRDEAEALGVVEPLYGTCTHVCFLEINNEKGTWPLRTSRKRKNNPMKYSANAYCLSTLSTA